MESRHKTFLRGASLLSILTLISRLLGLLREAVCAYFFGVSALWDDFMLAFCVPNLARRLFGEGALSAAFVPVFTEALESGEPLRARQLLGRVITLLVAVLCAGLLIGEALLVGLKPIVAGDVLPLTALMLPYMLFICLVALLAGAHNALGRFAGPALMPILFNVLFIACAVGAATASSTVGASVRWLAIGVVGAGAVQLLWQWLAIARAGCPPQLAWAPGDRDIVRIFGVMAPTILGLSAVQINVLGDMLVSKWFVGEGGVSSLTYGARLYQLPVGLFGAALATAILPGLSRLVSRDDHDGVAEMLDRGLRLSLFVGIPAAVGLCVVREDLVAVVFERGKFDADDTVRVSRVVWAYGAGVWAYVAQQVLVRGFYARREARTPMRIALWMVGLNLVLNVLFVQWLAEAGIALATAVSAAVQLGLLLSAYPRIGTLHWRSLGVTLCKAGFAAAIMAAVVLAVQAALGGDEQSRLIRLGASVCAGVSGYAVLAILTRSAELRELLAGIRP